MQDLLKGVGTLVFAYLRSAYITQKDDLTLKRFVKKLQKGRPELFVITSLLTEGAETVSVPLSHLTEMVDISSWTRRHNSTVT